MSSRETEIEWTGATWNPTVGCSLASPGCTNCYAMKGAYRMGLNPKLKGRYAGTAMKSATGKPVWTGAVRLLPTALEEPLRWRKPRMVFANSMSDLFHEALPIRDVARVFAVMGLAGRHTFQVLTKRTRRMCDWLNDPATPATVRTAAEMIRPGTQLPEWPLPNVWIGTSIEDQRRADERLLLLLECKAAIRFVSAEPLLHRVSLAEALCRAGHSAAVSERLLRERLAWLIAGGESGPGARPMHPAWARSLRDECATLGTAFFFKQRGHWTWDPPSRRVKSVCLLPDGTIVKPGTTGAVTLYGVGKAEAGCLLDGREHREFPLAA
jgi:protein gp37